MRHPYEKFILGELISIGLALLFGLIALIRGSFPLLMLSLFLLVISLICTGVIFLYSNRSTEAGKQILRAAILFLLIIYLIIR